MNVRNRLLEAESSVRYKDAKIKHLENKIYAYSSQLAELGELLGKYRIGYNDVPVLSQAIVYISEAFHEIEDLRRKLRAKEDQVNSLLNRGS